MKLFKKICLQVFLGMLVLAVGMLWFLVWEMQRQNLSDVCQYEKERIRQSVENIREKVLRENSGYTVDSVKNTLIISAFRNEFRTGGALAKAQKEIFNISSYKFDWAELERLSETSGVWEEDMFISAPQMTEGKRLILFYQEEVSFGTEVYSIVAYKDVTDIYHRTRSLFLRGMFFTVVVFFVVVFLLFIGIYRMVQPLNELKKAAVGIADGEYADRVPVRGKDEIAEVSMSFNQMAEKVEENMEMLTEVNKRQRQLLGSLAHELRTPMTAIIGHVDMLMTLKLGQRQREEALGYILSEGKRLSRLSEKMLELTGLYENGGIRAQMKETSIRQILDKLKILTTFQLGDRGIRLEIEMVSENLCKPMDEDLMLSLLINLVDNACKASEVQGRICIWADAHGITVEDFGKGIPGEEIRHVTEAFYMVDKSRARNAGGIGLGLALCQQIAWIHGGRLQIESIQDKGTKVSVLW